MVAAIEARGGRIETGATVTRVLQQDGRATGIELADGRKVYATKAVIAGVAPGALPKLTGTATDFDAKLAQFAHAPGTMMIHLALSALPDCPQGHPYPGAKLHLLVTDALDDPDQVIAALKAIAADLPAPKPKKPEI